MPSSTLTSKGQTTVPKEIRDHLHLKPGDRIDYLIDKDGNVLFIAATLSVKDLAGCLKREGRKMPVTLEEMDEAIAACAAEGCKP